MEGRKIIKITNQCQFQTLVELMEKQEDLARGFKRGISKVDFKKEWKLIADILNSKGPPVRDGDGWQKVWADLKFKVKKMVHNSKELKKTGGGPNQLQILSPMEDAIANMLDYNKLINPSGCSIGASNSDVLENVTPNVAPIPPLDLNASCSDADEIYTEVRRESFEMQQEANPVPNTKRRITGFNFKQERSEILRKQKQSILQESSFNCINESLKKILEHTKETERYQRKLFKLEEENSKRDIKRFKMEEEKLMLYKQEIEENKKQRQEENKIKLMNLEIKKKHIEIQEKILTFKSSKEN